MQDHTECSIQFERQMNRQRMNGILFRLMEQKGKEG